MANQTKADIAAAGGARGPLWAEALATWFGCGYGKPGPGTWGSIGGILVWLAFAPWLPKEWLTPAALIYVAIVIIVGVPAATVVARAAKVEDPSKVVIDEVAGQMITLIAAPLCWQTTLAGLILFRAFDILKPPPVRQLERLPEGWGIMFDDIAAGCLGWICLQLLLRYHLLGHIV